MKNLTDGCDASHEMLKMQVTQNIEFILKELEAFAKPANSFNSSPTYKTLFSLNLASFYERFGSETTKLYRLTKTHYIQNLPHICVVHTIPELKAHEDRALLIEDKIFISHQYFKKWLIAEDKDLYEKEILDLILSSLDTNKYNMSN